jgi:hypothetical protein
MIRARVHRDAPGVWSFDIFDDATTELLIVGDAYTWGSAVDQAVDELRLFAERDQPPGWEIPIVSPTPPLISPEARARSWLARVLCPVP